MRSRHLANKSIWELLGGVTHFGRLTALEESDPRWSGRQYRRWVRCKCACGSEAVVSAQSLKSGATRSCGCLQRESVAARSRGRPPANATHGRSRTPEYIAWNAMKMRCTHEGAGFENYGGRGIAVCPEWEHDFPAFYAHIGPKPGPGRAWSVDRIDNDRGYEPGNVRWATTATQGRNRRTNHLVEHQGRTVTLMDLAEQHGMAWHTLKRRLDRGWSLSDALVMPVANNGAPGRPKPRKAA